MAKTVFEIMNARYSFLTTTINSLEKKKNSYPDGIINIKTTKSGSYYYWHIDNKRNYLGRKDTDLVKQLIQKDLVSKAIKTAQKEASTAERWGTKVMWKIWSAGSTSMAKPEYTAVTGSAFLLSLQIIHWISAGSMTSSKRTSGRTRPPSRRGSNKSAQFYLWYFSPLAILKPR